MPAYGPLGDPKEERAGRAQGKKAWHLDQRNLPGEEVILWEEALDHLPGRQ